MKKSIFAYTILFVCIVMASVVSSVFSPIGMLRAFIVAGLLACTFNILNYRTFDVVTKIVNVLVYTIAASLALYFLPYSQMYFQYLTHNPAQAEKFIIEMQLLGFIRVVGYFIVIVVANYAAIFTANRIKVESEKNRKLLFGAILFLLGIIGGTLVSCVNNPIFIVMSMVSGLVYSAFIYFAFFMFIMFNKLPEQLIKHEDTK